MLERIQQDKQWKWREIKTKHNNTLMFTQKQKLNKRNEIQHNKKYNQPYKYVTLDTSRMMKEEIVRDHCEIERNRGIIAGVAKRSRLRRGTLQLDMSVPRNLALSDMLRKTLGLSEQISEGFLLFFFLILETIPPPIFSSNVLERFPLGFDIFKRFEGNFRAF